MAVTKQVDGQVQVGVLAGGVDQRRKSLHPGILVALTVLLAVLLRLWFLHSSMGAADSDEAVVGLMARHMGHGEFTTFFWGQSYGGTLEIGLVAALFKVVGSSQFALKIVPLALCSLAAFLLWRIGLRLVSAHVARLAACLFLVYPGAFVWFSMKERGFYWVTLCLELTALLCALSLAAIGYHQEQSPSVTSFWKNASIIGVCAGLAWWQTPQSVYFLLPLFVWMLVRIPNRLRWMPVVSVGGLVGAAPWIVYNVRNGLASFDQPPVAVATSYFGRVKLLITELLPGLFGLRIPYSLTWVLGGFGVAMYVGLLVLFGFVMLREVRSGNRGWEPLVIICVCFPFLAAIAKTGFYTGEPRYGLVLSPILALVIARLIGHKQVLQYAVVIAAVGLSSYTGVSMLRFGRANPTDYDLIAPRVGQLNAYLETHALNRTYADYWIGYRAMFVSDEKIVVSPVVAQRNTQFLAKVERAPRSVFVLGPKSANLAPLTTSLEQLGINFRVVTIGSDTVIVLDRQLKLAELPNPWS